MQKTQVVTAKQQQDDLLAYFERLDELSVEELINEAKQFGGFTKEKMLVAALSKRLEIYLHGIEDLNAAIVRQLEAA